MAGLVENLAAVFGLVMIQIFSSRNMHLATAPTVN